MGLMEILLYTTLLGLTLDIVGFILLVRYGHSLFMRSGADLPVDNIGKDGDLYFTTPRGRRGTRYPPEILGPRRSRYRVDWIYPSGCRFNSGDMFV